MGADTKSLGKVTRPSSDRSCSYPAENIDIYKNIKKLEEPPNICCIALKARTAHREKSFNDSKKKKIYEKK